jgi:UDP-N-acetylmuramyl pentapeptide phosphotransferase/UDP-N-acetylglucosamine-1-phosphate transferase
MNDRNARRLRLLFVTFAGAAIVASVALQNSCILALGYFVPFSVLLFHTWHCWFRSRDWQTFLSFSFAVVVFVLMGFFFWSLWDYRLVRGDTGSQQFVGEVMTAPQRGSLRNDRAIVNAYH